MFQLACSGSSLRRASRSLALKSVKRKGQQRRAQCRQRSALKTWLGPLPRQPRHVQPPYGGRLLTCKWVDALLVLGHVPAREAGGEIRGAGGTYRGSALGRGRLSAFEPASKHPARS